MKYVRDLLRVLLLALLAVLLVNSVTPFLAGVWYAGCGDRNVEQAWLNRVTRHLTVLREHCDDPDLQGVLDYTIYRYHRIGAWDVMVWPLATIDPRYKVIGCNWPFCPGITIDPEVMTYPISEGALVVVHEALHDYWPCFGHSQVDPRIDKLEALTRQL